MNIDPELREKLVLLFSAHPNLFDVINLDGYNLETGEEWAEILRDGESALIEIEGKNYRFSLDEVAKYIGDEVYDL